MAWRFPSTYADHCYFPTVHVHDGEEPEMERFDHALYAQGPGRLVPDVTVKAPGASPWTGYPRPTDGALTSFCSAELEPARESGVVDLELPLHHRPVVGLQENRDIWVKWV